MRKNIHPAATVGLIVAAILGIGLLGWNLAGALHTEPQAVVKPAHPDDPIYQRDPKLGASLGGGASDAAKGNTSD